MTAVCLNFVSLLVEGDFDPAHSGTRRAPERVSLHHSHFAAIGSLSLSTNQMSLHRVYLLCVGKIEVACSLVRTKLRVKNAQQGDLHSALLLWSCSNQRMRRSACHTAAHLEEAVSDQGPCELCSVEYLMPLLELLAILATRRPVHENHTVYFCTQRVPAEAFAWHIFNSVAAGEKGVPLHPFDVR